MPWDLCNACDHKYNCNKMKEVGELEKKLHVNLNVDLCRDFKSSEGGIE